MRAMAAEITSSHSQLFSIKLFSRMAKDIPKWTDQLRCGLTRSIRAPSPVKWCSKALKTRWTNSRLQRTKVSTKLHLFGSTFMRYPQWPLQKKIRKSFWILQNSLSRRTLRQMSLMKLLSYQRVKIHRSILIEKCWARIAVLTIWRSRRLTSQSWRAINHQRLNSHSLQRLKIKIVNSSCKRQVVSRSVSP